MFNRLCRALISDRPSSTTFERHLSGRFSPLLAPLPLHRFFSHARSPLRCRSLNFQPAQLRFPLRSRSAHMLWSQSINYVSRKNKIPSMQFYRW